MICVLRILLDLLTTSAIGTFDPSPSGSPSGSTRPAAPIKPPVLSIQTGKIRSDSSHTELPAFDRTSMSSRRTWNVVLNVLKAETTTYPTENNRLTSDGSTNGGSLPITPTRRPALFIQTRTVRPTFSSTDSPTVIDTDSIDESIDCPLNKLNAGQAST